MSTNYASNGDEFVDIVFVVRNWKNMYICSKIGLYYYETKLAQGDLLETPWRIIVTN